MIDKIIELAVEEDFGLGDITTDNIFGPNDFIKAAFIAKDDMVVCGGETARAVFSYVDPAVKFKQLKKYGEYVKKGAKLAEVSGPALGVLKGERPALNFMQRMSGIATMAFELNKVAKKYKVMLVDTRKSLPGMRKLDKYAVRTGGAKNHRMSLADSVMIKDNHIDILGVIPYYKDIVIEEEDSVSLATKSMEARQGKVNVAVVLLRHLSNFTDFNALERDSRIHLFYTNNIHELEKADIIILPGSKNTIDDLTELRCNGVAGAILRAHREGTTVLGICGGYQMMGREILDPDHVEGDTERSPGLGLLPVCTRMTSKKVTRQVRFRLNIPAETAWMEGYEIHMGITIPDTKEPLLPLTYLSDGTMEGYIINRHCMGTYLHGILDNQPFIDFLLAPYTEKQKERNVFNYHAFKEEQYDKLATHIRAHVNIPLLYNILTTDNL